MVEGYYCYINDIGTICAGNSEQDYTLYKLRLKIGNVFPNVNTAKESLNKIVEVLQCQQCVDSEGM